MLEEILEQKVPHRKEVKKWIDAMNREPSGRCITASLEREAEIGNLRSETLAEFLEALGKRVAARGIPLDPGQLLMESRDGEPKQFCVAGVAHPSRDDRCSRILSARQLLKYYGCHLGYPSNRRGERKLLRNVEGGSITAEKLRGTLCGKSPFFGWVTKSEEVEEVVLRYDAVERGLQVRDRLGLSQYRRNDVLVEVKCPHSFCHSICVAVPTAIDAGDDVWFRPAPDEKGWGRAVDMSSLDVGMSQAVHVSCDMGSSYDLRPIGPVNHDPPKPVYDRLLRINKGGK